MDFRDYKEGASPDFFWFRAKRGLISVLLEKLSLENKSRILNVGAGTGEDMEVISAFGDVYAVDNEQEALALIPDIAVVDKKLSDVKQMPYPDNFFDAAMAFDVFEHVKDDKAAVREIIRVLKPGGVLVYTAPAFNFLYSAHDKELGHFRRYNKKSATDLMSELRLIDIGYWMCFLSPALALARLLKRSRQTTGFRYEKFNRFLNAVCYRILSIENKLLGKGIHLPIGTTIYGIFKKDQ
jgi:SAM-dependent methyltransferase